MSRTYRRQLTHESNLRSNDIVHYRLDDWVEAEVSEKTCKPQCGVCGKPDKKAQRKKQRQDGRQQSRQGKFDKQD